MPSVDDLAREIVRREGGFVNDPSDPGGATKYGVTIHTARRLKLDLNADGLVDVRDVKLISRDLATDIFKRQYYLAPRINLLPADLRPSVFDMYVNAGGNAVRILQRVLGGFGQVVTVDGALGPKSAQAAQAAVDLAGGLTVADAYGIGRRNYYYALADGRVKSRKYARRQDGGKGGWITRAEEFISPRFHLTNAQHKARVSQWAA